MPGVLRTRHPSRSGPESGVRLHSDDDNSSGEHEGEPRIGRPYPRPMHPPPTTEGGSPDFVETDCGRPNHALIGWYCNRSQDAARFDSELRPWDSDVPRVSATILVDAATPSSLHQRRRQSRTRATYQARYVRHKYAFDSEASLLFRVDGSDPGELCSIRRVLVAFYRPPSVGQ
jgi:hypothetical protein